MHTLLDRDSKKAPPGSGSFYGSGFGFGSDRPSAAAAGMFSCVGCFWVLLSCALVAVCSFSFVSPAWVVREQHLRSGDSVSFGLLWRCSESLDRRYRCYAFGGLGRFAEIPSSSWQISEMKNGGICSLAAHVSTKYLLFLSGIDNRQFCPLGYRGKCMFIMGSGLLVYPFGLNSSLVRSFCGNSDIYNAGDCQIGWGYMLAIVGVMLTLFLPFFAKYAPKEQLSPTPLPTLL
ncbi:unnamed protein product [Merluccius merluccius]